MEARCKKPLYHRSKTLSTLPLKASTDNSCQSSTTHPKVPLKSRQSFHHKTTTSPKPAATALTKSPPSLEHLSKNLESVSRASFVNKKHNAATHNNSLPDQTYTKNHTRSEESIQIPAKWVTTPLNNNNNNSNNTRPKSLSRKISSNDFNQSTLLVAARASSSSSNIFSRVKDKIVETVYQTQDMPHLAAIVQERRQKAVEEFESKIVDSINRSLNNAGDGVVADAGNAYPDCSFNKSFSSDSKNSRNSINEQTPSKKLTSSFLKKISSVETSGGRNKEKARLAFRRRSISQDSYPAEILPLKQTNSGITCSSTDFHAINNYRRISCNNNAPLSSASKKESFQKSKQTRKNTTTCTADSKLATSSMHSPPSSNKLPQTTDGRLCGHKHLCQHPSEAGLARIAETEVSQRSSFELQDVEYDENGQTWSVYGAELDPEILGSAIQMHLDRLMRQRTAEAAKGTEEAPATKRKNKLNAASKIFTFLNLKIGVKEN